MSQGALIGVQPMPLEYAPIEEIQTLSASNMSLSGDNISAFFSNSTTQSHTASCGIGFVDDEGNVMLVKKWGYAPSPISPHATFGNVEFTVQASDFSWSNVPYGTYQLVPICLLDDEAEWKLCDMNQPEYVEAQYAEDGSLTLTMHAYEINLEATGFEFPGAHLTGATEIVNMTLNNNGSEFQGNVYFFVNGTQEGVTGVALRAGKSTTLSFSFKPSTAGTYNISVSLNENDTNPIGISSIDIAQGSAVDDLTVSSFEVENTNNQVVY
jgi:hypothetical protein